MSLRTVLGLTGLISSAALVVSLSRPDIAAGFNLLGGELDIDRRAFRVNNNFADSGANNNQTPDALFPGAQGATMAIWKGHAEWASGPWAGSGNGDPTQGVLGSGGANFDNKFEGETASPGGTNSNTHSVLGGSSGGVLAFMQGPISDGWMIRYYETWAWKDGPGSNGSTDIQGVACHEIGHSLGLDHSGASGATMQAFISGSGVSARSINSDDQAGVQAIYGVKSASKPEITGLSGSQDTGEVLTLLGDNFHPSNNEVWFTSFNSPGVPTKVTGVGSTNGGTRIDVTIPVGIADGDVMVRDGSKTSHDALSNAFPIDISVGSLSPPFLAAVDPAFGPGGGFTPVQITGTGFDGVTSVTFGAEDAISFTIDSDSQITAISPPATPFAQVAITVTDDSGSDQWPSYLYTFNPPIAANGVAPGSGPSAGGTVVTITGSSLVGINQVTFGGVPGTDLTPLSATEASVVTPPGSGTVDVVVSGSGSSTIQDGFVFVASGAFVDIGPGVAGTTGMPLLTGSGDLAPGSASGFDVTVSQAQPFAAGFLFLAFSEGALPFKGGTFYPLPIAFQTVLPMDATGSLTLGGTIAPGTPTSNVIAQWWFSDAGAPAGAAGSNGLRIEIP